MDLMGLLRAIFALAIVLGLIMAFAYILKRYAPQFLAQLQAKRGEKRMEVVETLVLDPARRLVLVRLDGEERLILLGEGNELGQPGKVNVLPRPVAKPAAAPPVAEDVAQRAAAVGHERAPLATPASARAKIALAPVPAAKPGRTPQDPNDDLF